MILVCGFYAVSSAPLYVYYLFVIFDAKFTLLDSSYYALLFVSFLYICANPFVYATKFDPVRRVLLRWNQTRQVAPDRVELRGVNERVGADVEKWDKQKCVVADPARRVLRRLIPCKKTSVPVVENVEMAGITPVR